MAGDLVNIQMKLLFVPKEPWGSVGDAKKVNFIRLEEDLVEDANTSALPINARFARQDLYRRATALCRSLRRTEKNCSPYNISIYTRPMPKGDTLLLSGKATFSFLQEVATPGL